MKKFILPIVMLLCSISIYAYEPRDLLQKKANEQQVKSFVAPTGEWVKYPAYTNRAAWDELTGKNKNELIHDAESNLNYEWKVIKATNYLEYERSGSRVALENPFNSNNKALSQLVYGELAEGKGRFMDQIINGIWHTCEMSSWALSAHLVAQKTKRSLPEYNEELIDLTSGQLASFLSWTWYFLHDEMDKVNPVIASKLRKTIQERILAPYMARNDYWWQAVNYKPGTLVNNWNPWCNSNVLICFLLLEQDQDKLSAAIYKTMQSVDKFINYVNEDGACEEGPSYWGHAAGKMYDYLQILNNATNGNVNIFNEPITKNMGEYIARSYVGNGWVVNFADASAKGGGDAGLIFRYGQAVNSMQMQQFASYLLLYGNNEIDAGIDFFRTIENLSSFSKMEQTPPALPSEKYSWYPQTQFCYMKNSQDFFFAAKGGYNNESHNHNDIGTFSLYVNTVPVFIDAGVGTYTRETFSNQRYNIWTMQSNYHNLPMINGLPQQYGAAFRAKNVNFNTANSTLSIDISAAYNADASVKKWTRTYKLSLNDGLVIEDDFDLSALKENNRVNFLTWSKPDISSTGIVFLKKDSASVKMKYDATLFSAQVETIALTDTRLSNVWGSEVYRLVFTAKKQQLNGRYRFVVSKL